MRTAKGRGWAAWNVDCLDGMARMGPESIDAVIADLPYGITPAEWDKMLPLDEMWFHYNRIVKEGSPIILTAAQPFSSMLVASNLEAFRYEWIWEKETGTGFLNANRRPLKSHEAVLVFCSKSPPYYPQMREGRRYKTRSRGVGESTTTDKSVVGWVTEGFGRYPMTILRFPREKGLHSTQKPVNLMSYLVRTYTRPGQLVLDNTMGSGSTGVACMQLGRRFFGMEVDPEKFDGAITRLKSQASNTGLFS